MNGTELSTLQYLEQQLGKLESQIYYTAVMTDTLIEEDTEDDGENATEV